MCECSPPPAQPILREKGTLVGQIAAAAWFLQSLTVKGVLTESQFAIGPELKLPPSIGWNLQGWVHI